jgi:CoA transferase family III
MLTTTTESALFELLTLRKSTPPYENLVNTGTDPVLPTRFPLGETSAAIQLAVGVAVNDIWAARTGRRQDLSIHTTHAAAALKSYEYFFEPSDSGAQNWAMQRARQQISTPHPTRDGRYFLPHMGLPHLAQRILNILNCEYELNSVVDAVAKWDALELENAVAAAGGCGAMVRSEAQWQASEHGGLLAKCPVIEIEKLADSDPIPFAIDNAANIRPLTGTRVLDLTRILAGPTCARTLAEHGADVLMVTAEHLPQADRFVKDTSHGKRSCFLDLTHPEQHQRLLNLLNTADVFSQGYRPGAMARLGLSPDELCRLKPGLIYTSMNCYGYEGPFADRAGWEQLAQTVTGIAHEHGGDRPRLLPAAACDYTTGYLAAYGTLLALGLRARVGGSYHVKTSLCQSAMFLQRQRRVELTDKQPNINTADLAEVMCTADSDDGHIHFLGPVLKMSETSPHWARPTPKLGSHPAAW